MGFYPNAGSQLAFLSSPVWETLIEGTRGGGKTDIVLMDYAQHVGRGFKANWRGVLFRQTYKQLDDVVARSKKWFWQIFPHSKFNGSDYKWQFPTGEELLLRRFSAPDDYWDYHGHEYPWIGWEELTNWPTVECYDSMKSCSRSSHPGMPRKYRANCNPWGIGHNWVKQYYIDPAPPGTIIREYAKDGTSLLSERTRIRSFVWENTALMEADPTYVAKLASIKNKNKRRAWLRGDWDVVSGGILDGIWDEQSHVIAPFRIPSTWRIDRAFDWGSSKPFWVGWWAESDGTGVKLPDGTTKHYPRGSLFLIAEWYGWNGTPNQGLHMLSSKIGSGIKEREEIILRNLVIPGGTIVPGPADASIFDIENGNCIADDMSVAGVRWERADKSPGSRVQGWEKLREYLNNSAEQNDEPGMRIFNTCRHWIRTVPGLPRDEKNPDDVDSAAEDHAGDGTRYRIWTAQRGLVKVAISGS
jgi:hypothetical protein